jgi:hypothetical protein
VHVFLNEEESAPLGFTAAGIKTTETDKINDISAKKSGTTIILVDCKKKVGKIADLHLKFCFLRSFFVYFVNLRQHTYGH